MARTLFAADPASFTVAASGRIVPGTTLSVKDANGDAVTDLLAAVWDADTFTWTQGAAITSVTSDDDGLIAFFGPDNYDGPLYLTGGTTAALLVRPHIVGVNLGPGVIGATQLATSAVTSAKIAAGAVTTAKIATGAVTTTEIADDAVTAAKIAADAVGSSEIAAGAVGTSELADDSVTAAKIATDAVGASEIAAGAVGTSEIADAAVTTAKIAAGAVVEVDIASSAVTTAKIADGAVTAAKTTGAITAAQTTNFTATSADSIVVVDTSSGAVTVTLPAASTMTGRMLRIVKTGGANTLTIARAGSDTIIPATGSRTSLQFPAATHGEILIASTGSAWHAISGQASDESVGRRIWKWEQALAAPSSSATVGFQLIFADTGWRRLSTGDLINGWTVATSTNAPRIRRELDTVTIVGTPVKSGATASKFYNVPAGFQAWIYATDAGTWTTTTGSSTSSWRLEYATDHTLSANTAASAGSTLVLNGRWNTSDAWPASLPGVAVGTIPTGA